MKKKDNTYTMYLQDILTSLDRIIQYIQGFRFRQFKQDNKTVDAVIRNFEIIAEATKNLPDEIKSKYPEVPWAEMYLLRNKISYEYFGVDYEIIWDVAVNYLPENKKQIETILNEEERNTGA